MTPSVPSRRLPPPELPGHTWLRALGSGGFADVHLYRQELPAREVAVKVARSVGDQVEYAQIRHEADVMTSIAGHPAVVELYSIGTSPDGRPYLEMEFCPVANVAEQVRRMPMAVDRALDVVIRLCGGVEMLHRNGYVHRDIKPANVMFDSYNYPVLGDFGVASRIGALEKGSLASQCSGLRLNNTIAPPTHIRLRMCGRWQQPCGHSSAGVAHSRIRLVTIVLPRWLLESMRDASVGFRVRMPRRNLSAFCATRCSWIPGRGLPQRLN